MTPLLTALFAAAFPVLLCTDAGSVHQRTHDHLVQATGAAPQSKAAARARGAFPGVELTEQIMFKLMLAEVALQREQPHVAVPAFLDLARETRDPRLAQRATEIAWNARFADAALEAASIWLQVEPGSARARQVLGAMLVNQQKLDTARGHFEQWLSSDRDNIGQSFLQLSTVLGRNADRTAVLELTRALAQPYPKVPEARLAVAQAAWNAGNEALALEESSAALRLRPDWEIAALFRAQALQRRSPDEAIAFLGEYLKAHPQAKDVRLNYARLLIAAKRYPEARQQFDPLVQLFPNNPDVSMAVALLAIQANDFDDAEARLLKALQDGHGEPDVVRMYLGQLNDERKRYDQALKWYAEVQPGDQYINAQAGYASVLSKQGKLPEARRHLQQQSAQTPEQRAQLAQAEAQILRDATAYKDAFEVLTVALQKIGDNPDLLYEHAMAAEKVDRVDVLESSLRKLIRIRPDHAHAYNALGYTLADRNQRLTEARELIEKALKLQPDDAFILDSMGWVLFRMGQTSEALEHLQRAYSRRPDADIAAHLGEVLWVQGQEAEARKVWAEALKESPKSEALQNTIKRLAPVILPAAR